MKKRKKYFDECEISYSHFKWANTLRAITAADCERERRLRSATHEHLLRVKREVISMASKNLPEASSSFTFSLPPTEFTVSLRANVLTQIERSFKQKEALLAQDRERQERVNLYKFNHVLEDLLHSVNIKSAIESASHEQVRQVQMNNLRVISNELLRKMNQREAILSMEHEQSIRMASEKMNVVLDELKRKNNGIVANFLCDQERIQRCSEKRVNPINPPELLLQIARSVTTRYVICAAETERTRRINMSVVYNPLDLLSEIRRHGNQKAVLAMMSAEKTRRILDAYFKDYVLAELHTKTTLSSISSAVALEQAQQVSQNYLVQTVHAELFRNLSKAYATKEVEKERQRRCNKPTPFRPSLAKVNEAICRRLELEEW